MKYDRKYFIFLFEWNVFACKLGFASQNKHLIVSFRFFQFIIRFIEDLPILFGSKLVIAINGILVQLNFAAFQIFC